MSPMPVSQQEQSVPKVCPLKSQKFSKFVGIHTISLLALAIIQSFPLVVAMTHTANLALVLHVKDRMATRLFALSLTVTTVAIPFLVLHPLTESAILATIGVTAAVSYLYPWKFLIS